MNVRPRSSALVLGAVLAVAAALRFWNLGHGLPFDLGVDEPGVLDPAIRMMKTGDFDPHVFIYPTLYTYVQLMVACLRFLLGATTGAWSTLGQVDSSDFYLWARGTTAIIGTATVWLVYRVGLRWDASTALVAAALMAVLPMHIRESHYVLTDVPMTFLTTLTCLLSLRATERATTGAFAAAGAVVGLAAATKYNGALAIVMPLIAAHFTAGRRGDCWRRDSVVIGAAACAFLIAMPYAVLSLPRFLDDYARVSSQHTEGGGNEPAWLTFLKHLRLTFGWPGIVLAGAGCVLAVVRSVAGPARARFWLITAFPLLTFYLIAWKGSHAYGRYLIPILPFACLFVGLAAMEGIRLLRDTNQPRQARAALIALGALAVLLPPAVTAIQFDRRLAGSSTRAVAYIWIRGNVPQGSRVVVETNALWLPEARYRVLYVTRLSDRSLNQYIRDKAEFLIATSSRNGFSFPDSTLDSESAERNRVLLDGTRQLASIKPGESTPGAEIRVFAIEP